MSCKGNKKYKSKDGCQIAYVGSCGYYQRPGGMVPREGCNPAGGVTPQMVAKALSIALSGPIGDFPFTFTGALLGRHAASRLVGFGPNGSSGVTLPNVLAAFAKALVYLPNGGFGGAFMKFVTCSDNSLGDADCPVSSSSCCTVSSTPPAACDDCTGRQDGVFDIKVGEYKNAPLTFIQLSVHGGISSIGNGSIVLPCSGCYILRYLIQSDDTSSAAVQITGTCTVVPSPPIVTQTGYILGQAAIKSCGTGSCTITLSILGTITTKPPSLVFIHRYGTC